MSSRIDKIRERRAGISPTPWTHFYPAARDFAHYGVIRPAPATIMIDGVEVDASPAGGIRYQVPGKTVNGVDRGAVAYISEPKTRNHSSNELRGYHMGHEQTRADGEFIAHAPDDIDYLLSQLKDGGAENRDKRLLRRSEIAEIERLQNQRRKSPVAVDAWLYVAEIDQLLGHIRYAELQGYIDQIDAATAPTGTGAAAEQCDFCAHPSGYFPAELEGDKWIHRGRDNDAQICTATPHPCPDCGEMKTSPECMNCQAIGIERIEREARQSIQAEEAETSARCGECGHTWELERSADGSCNELSESGNDQRCGCKCLLPCPFCGPGQSKVDLYFDDTANRYRVGCGRCGCSTGISPRDKTEAPAIAAWNTRAGGKCIFPASTEADPTTPVTQGWTPEQFAKLMPELSEQERSKILADSVAQPEAEPSLSDLAIQAANYLAKLDDEQARYISFALRARVASTTTPASAAVEAAAREIAELLLVKPEFIEAWAMKFAAILSRYLPVQQPEVETSYRAEQRQLIQDLASFPFDVLMDDNAPRVAIIGSVSTLRHMQARAQEILATAAALEQLKEKGNK